LIRSIFLYFRSAAVLTRRTWIEADENYQQEQSLAHPPTLFLLSGGRGQVRGILYPKKLVKGISTSKR